MAALELQRRLVELRHSGEVGNVLLLLEHPPVLTLGRNAQRSNIIASDAELERRGVGVHEINRGGDVTYHGPGQLVGYPIFDLRSFSGLEGSSGRLGPVGYVRLVEEALIRFCASYGVLTQRIAGRTGVWTRPAAPVVASSRGDGSNVICEKKIAAIGVHISRGITSHGLALNLTADLRDFELIVPCGIADRSVTSLELEIDSASHPMPGLEEAANQVARQFGRVFEAQVLRLDSLRALHPGLPELESSSAAAAVDAAAPATPEDTPMRIPKELRRLHGEEDSFRV